jgi:hypothetical protein
LTLVFSFILWPIFTCLASLLLTFSLDIHTNIEKCFVFERVFVWKAREILMFLSGPWSLRVQSCQECTKVIVCKDRNSLFVLRVVKSVSWFFVGSMFGLFCYYYKFLFFSGELLDFSVIF